MSKSNATSKNTKVPAPRGVNGVDVQDHKEESWIRGQKRIAARFVRLNRGRFIYTTGREWLEWNGAYWEACDDAAPWRAVHETCRAAFVDMSKMEAGKARDELYADIRACESQNGTAGVLAHVKRAFGICVKDEELNNKPHLFVFQNGTFDLYAGEFRASDPNDFMTLSAGCDYDPEATCPFYDELLKLYQPDEEIRDYLHRLAGAAMEGRQNLQNLYCWYGSRGGNGKGTTMKAWQNVFGTFFKILPVEALLTRKSDSDAYRDEKAQLQGVRLVLATEPKQGSRFDAGTVKSITGGDTVSARAMYKSKIEFEPTWLIIMPTNDRVSTPNDGGMARRLKEIGWNYKIQPGTERDDIEEKLRAEASGIANHIIAGWWDYKAFGIQHPESVEKATKEYMDEVDPIVRFLSETIIAQPGESIQSSKLYAKYRLWCEEDDGTRPVSQVRFSKDLTAKGYERKDARTGRFWVNMAIVG